MVEQPLEVVQDRRSRIEELEAACSDLTTRNLALEAGIRRHLLAINPDGSHRFAMEADVELWTLIEGVD